MLVHAHAGHGIVVLLGPGGEREACEDREENDSDAAQMRPEARRHGMDDACWQSSIAREKRWMRAGHRHSSADQASILQHSIKSR